jgi:type II secretory ATPase GspE/PulE/Tfp pilus assembly ATPase PilB-like protein
MGIPSSAVSGLRRSRGCLECGFSGTSGRRPLFEILEPSRGVAGFIVAGRDGDVRKAALESGFVPVVSQARERVVSGEIRLEEAYRTCYFGDPG